MVDISNPVGHYIKKKFCSGPPLEKILGAPLVPMDIFAKMETVSISIVSVSIVDTYLFILHELTHL